MMGVVAKCSSCMTPEEDGMRYTTGTDPFDCRVFRYRKPQAIETPQGKERSQNDKGAQPGTVTAEPRPVESV